jgi:hypothetical protein
MSGGMSRPQKSLVGINDRRKHVENGAVDCLSCFSPGFLRRGHVFSAVNRIAFELPLMPKITGGHCRDTTVIREKWGEQRCSRVRDGETIGGMKDGLGSNLVTGWYGPKRRGSGLPFSRTASCFPVADTTTPLLTPFLTNHRRVPTVSAGDLGCSTQGGQDCRDPLYPIS